MPFAAIEKSALRSESLDEAHRALEPKHLGQALAAFNPLIVRTMFGRDAIGEPLDFVQV